MSYFSIPLTLSVLKIRVKQMSGKKVVNVMCSLFVDVLFGFILHTYLTDEFISHIGQQHALQLTRLENIIVWLMGAPAGFKVHLKYILILSANRFNIFSF